MSEHDRVLRDAREMRVLAHPVRMRLQQALYERGSATATELAEMIGESPANCSWHLRQLAKHGFVEETGDGTGRNRPWLPSVLAGRVVGGLGLSIMFVGFTTVLQRRTPGPLVGRVSMAAETLTSGPQTISIAAGAMLVSAVNYRLLLAIVLIGMFTGAGYLWSGRRLTRPLRHAEPSAMATDTS